MSVITRDKSLELKILMLRSGVRQADVATRLGISPGHLSNLLSGTAPINDQDFLLRRIRKIIRELAQAEEYYGS